MNYKNKYYKYKQKYKNLKKLYGEVKTRSKFVGGSAAEEQAAQGIEAIAAAAAAAEEQAAQGIEAIAAAAVEAQAAAAEEAPVEEGAAAEQDFSESSEDEAAVVPGAPQGNQIRVPNDLIVLFKETFINNVNDSLKLYLCLHKSFNYQFKTPIKIKILECVNNWHQQVLRLTRAFPHLIFDPELNSAYNLIFVCIGNLIITAEQGLAEFNQETINSYLSLDDPQTGPTELDCTGFVRQRLDFDSNNNNFTYVPYL